MVCFFKEKQKKNIGKNINTHYWVHSKYCLAKSKCIITLVCYSILFCETENKCDFTMIIILSFEQNPIVYEKFFFFLLRTLWYCLPLCSFYCLIDSRCQWEVILRCNRSFLIGFFSPVPILTCLRKYKYTCPSVGSHFI